MDGRRRYIVSANNDLMPWWFFLFTVLLIKIILCLCGCLDIVQSQTTIWLDFALKCSQRPRADFFQLYSAVCTYNEKSHTYRWLCNDIVFSRQRLKISGVHMTQRLGGVHEPHVPRSNRHPHAFHASHTLPAHLLFLESQPFGRVILHFSLLDTYRGHLCKRFSQKFLELSTSRNESAMDSLCGPSNALQNAQKHTSVDRTLQQDRLISRQPPTQVSRFPRSQEVLPITYLIYRDFDRKARKAS